MPNWTSNSIRIEGAEPDLRAFLEAVKWQDEIFDFNRIIPMPELLKHTGSGYQTIDGKEVREWYVIGNETALLTNDKAVRLFTPEEEATLKEIGHRDWYTWCSENWGTKWNACRAELAEDCAKEGYIEIRFETAWAPPMPVIEKMFEMFPKLSFVCTWENEGECERYSIEHDAVADDEENISPIAAAKLLTPWWMLRIRDFDGLEIQPCAVIGRDSSGGKIVEPCEPKEADFWTVYGHYRPGGPMGGVDSLEDFPTEAEAQEFHDRLVSVYPHLAADGGRP